MTATSIKRKQEMAAASAAAHRKTPIRTIPVHTKSEPIPGVNPNVAPSGTGCVECLKSGKGWWLHLRRCAECGHIGCCDSSPMQHATKHSHGTKHPIAQSFEPGEDWFYNYQTGEEVILPAGTLSEPRHHPLDQAVPFYVGQS